MSDHIEMTKNFYLAFSDANKDYVEELLAPNFTFSAPTDPLLDRQQFFDICWNGGAGNLHDFNFIRAIENANEVVVTYEMKLPTGKKTRNTEVMTFDGDKIVRCEVYFGWNVEDNSSPPLLTT